MPDGPSPPSWFVCACDLNHRHRIASWAFTTNFWSMNYKVTPVRTSPWRHAFVRARIFRRAIWRASWYTPTATRSQTQRLVSYHRALENIRA